MTDASALLRSIPDVFRPLAQTHFGLLKPAVGSFLVSTEEINSFKHQLADCAELLRAAVKSVEVGEKKKKERMKKDLERLRIAIVWQKDRGTEGVDVEETVRQGSRPVEGLLVETSAWRWAVEHPFTELATFASSSPSRLSHLPHYHHPPRRRLHYRPPLLPFLLASRPKRISIPLDAARQSLRSMSPTLSTAAARRAASPTLSRFSFVPGSPTRSSVFGGINTHTVTFMPDGVSREAEVVKGSYGEIEEKEKRPASGWVKFAALAFLLATVVGIVAGVVVGTKGGGSLSSSSTASSTSSDAAGGGAAENTVSVDAAPAGGGATTTVAMAAR
ncbi:hypothetical protein JCM8547_000775 [Rhodosporidiobolus lusitaniae]